MKKAINLTKSLLFAATLSVLSFGVLPESAQAWVLTIYCDGSNSHCATVITGGVLIDIDLGNFEGGTLEL
ncbi:MAG: hypothetical protein HC897_19820 [Thermoanaerobaculia bacterium]|nr:hypothetical protein [Thermoanaerobaculia bacterium]